MIKKAIIVLMVLSGVVFGIRSYAEASQGLQTALGEDTIMAIAYSHEVVAQNVAQNRKPPFAFSSKEVTLSSPEIDQLKQFLLVETHYNKFGLKKRALFIPYAAFLFKGKTPITLYVSESSRELMVQSQGKKIYLNYDPMAKAFDEFTHHIVARGTSS